MKTKKPKKKRAKNYDSRLKIEGTFKQAIKVLVKDSKPKSKQETEPPKKN